MGSHAYKIDWDNFPEQTTATIRDIYKNEKFSDVTLVSEDLREIKAHRIVISSCSSALRRILYNVESPNPVLYLKGIKHQHLEAVLEFLYLGSVNIAQHDVTAVLAVARELKIHQLSSAQPERSGGGGGEVSAVTKHKMTEVVFFNNDCDDEADEAEADYYEEMDYNNSDVKGDCEEESEETHLSEAEIKTSYSDYEEEIADEDFVENVKVKEYRCTRCDINFSSYVELQLHKKTDDHPGLKYPCPQCPYVAGTSADRKKHIENIHEKKKHPCPQCDFEASSKGYLKIHLETHDGVRHNCQFCNVQFTNKSNLQRHIKTRHSNKGQLEKYY